VAKYSADIEIAVRGGQQLDRTIKTLNRLNNSINVVNRNAKLLEGKGFNVASIENYSRAVSKAERAVRKAAEGTDQERQAITALVRAMELENKARERKNILIAREVANQRRVIATADAGVGIQGPALPSYMLTGPRSPIRGSRSIPGSPAALAAKTVNRGANRLSGAISGAVIGGAFPLLFGQSGGAAAGGAIGGLAGGLLGPGGSFAGSLLGTLLGEVASKGQQVKELATDIGFTAEQTQRLQEAFALAGRDSDKFIESVQNIRGLSLTLDDQADAVQLVSNLTEIYGGKIDKVTNAFTSALESGKVTQATLNQLTSQGIPIQDALAKKYDVGRDKLLQMAKDGQISVQDLTDTLITLGNTGEGEAEKTVKGWSAAWESLQRGASLSLQATVAVFNAITGAGLESSGNIAADFAAMYVTLVKGAIDMGERIARIFAGIARGAANFAATAELGGVNIFAKGAVKGFKAVEQTFRNLDANLQSINLAEPGRGLVGAITAPGQLPPSGSTTRAGKSEAERELELMMKQLQAADDLNFKLKNKLTILEETDELTRREVELDIRLNEIAREYSELRTNAKSQDELTLINANEILEKKYAELEAERAINQILEDRARLRIELVREAALPGVFDPAGAQQAAVDALIEKYAVLGSVADSTAGLITFGFDEIISGTKSVEQVFADFLRNIANALLQAAQQMIAQYILIGIARRFAFGGVGAAASFSDFGGNVNVLGSAGAGFTDFGSTAFSPGGFDTSTFDAFAFGGARAMGGPTSPNTAYMVGEQGPELFVPNRTGTVVPNNALGGATSVIVNVDAKGTSVQGNDQSGNQLGRAIAAAVQAELVKQKRPGGLLTT